MSLSIKENIPLAPFTIYKIGGEARFFAEATTIDEIKEVLEFAKRHRVPFFVLGAGSNILVSDKGYDGVVIHMIKGGVTVNGKEVIATADMMMAHAVVKSAQAGLAGFEWGIGIPGTIGGSVRGNAGCFGGEMKDVVESVEVIQAVNGEWQTVQLDKNECEFVYRDSVFKRHPDWIIFSATLRLEEGNISKIQEDIRRISAERTVKQDIGTKSCGCIFKNVLWTRSDIDRGGLLRRFPEFKQFADQPNIPASFLIDHVGLKGKCQGKICISPKHANFFINEGGATAKEVLAAIAMAKEAVKNSYGILLEEEIQHIGS